MMNPSERSKPELNALVRDFLLPWDRDILLREFGDAAISSGFVSLLPFDKSAILLQYLPTRGGDRANSSPDQPLISMLRYRANEIPQR